MPCTMTGSLDGDRIESLREAVDRRERMLCAVCSLLERQQGPDALDDLLVKAATEAGGLKPKAIKKWWKQHKAADIAAGRH